MIVEFPGLYLSRLPIPPFHVAVFGSPDGIPHDVPVGAVAITRVGTGILTESSLFPDAAGIIQ